MDEQTKISYHEIDFLIPSYRFKIHFSYITKRGLSFIREFVLRLVHLSPMKPQNLSEYLGLSEREIKEALRDLIEKNDLTYNEQGQVILTSQSSNYFTILGSSPQVSDVLTQNTTLNFEMTKFNYISSNNSDNKWGCGLPIDIKSEIIANRNKLAEKAFQDQFDLLLDEKVLSYLRNSKNTSRPKIYKIDSTYSMGRKPLRIKYNFAMDHNGIAVIHDDIDQLKDDSAAQELISQTIFNHSSSMNFKDIINSIESFGDPYSSSLISEEGVDIGKFIEILHSEKANTGDFIPFIGPIYSENNWKTLNKQFETIKEKLTKKHQDGVKKLYWLAPSSGFWGYNDRIANCASELVNSSKTTGKKAKILYDPTFFLPIAEKHDGSTKHRWKQDFKNVLGNVNAYIEGFHNGVVDIFLLEDELVAITYYLTLPEVYPVPVPIGFISHDKRIIKQTHTQLTGYLESFDNEEDRKNLGRLSELK